MPALELICCVALGDAQVYHHLMPLAEHPLVERIWLVRTHLPRTGPLPRTSLVPVPRSRRLRFPAMQAQVLRLARRPAVRGMVSFNPFPYGLFGLPPALLGALRLHMGLIGSDWYRDAQGPAGPALRRTLRRADLVTVSGPLMQAAVVASGVPADRVAVLPHSIDVDRFATDLPRQVDFVFVGQLIERKRVDRILDAFARVAVDHPHARLRIVGRGPLKDALRDRAARLGVAERVEFVGYVDDVAPLLGTGRVFVMASEMEGLPFALIEAQCSGLVPISTPAGTIADHVHDGVDGFIVPGGAPADLAARMGALLDDPDRLADMRRATLQVREGYRHAAAAAVWTPWLERLAR
ncbi:MAG: glycosyltransferase [Alphaproteobacteria bacterium]|nr:glycosyltransferase [Alphaproteobacteria bacterium]